MITLFFLFTIQLLGGFFVVLCVEHFKNPSGSIIRRSLNHFKIYVQELYNRVNLDQYFITDVKKIFLSTFWFVILLNITSLFLSLMANTINYLSDLDLDRSTNSAEWLFFLYYILPICIWCIIMWFIWFFIKPLPSVSQQEVKGNSTAPTETLAKTINNY